MGAGRDVVVSMGDDFNSLCFFAMTNSVSNLIFYNLYFIYRFLQSSDENICRVGACFLRRGSVFGLLRALDVIAYKLNAAYNYEVLFGS